MKKTKQLVFVFLLLIFTFYLSNVLRVRAYANQYSEQQSDVALVLGAGAANGNISPVFQERINHAIYLLENDKVDYMLITGGFGDGQTLSDSQMAKNYAVSKGVLPSKILIEEESEYTFENIVNAKAIMDSLQLEDALLVSDPYHMLRAHKMCNKISIEHHPSPTQTSMYRSKKAKAKFIRGEAFYLMGFQLWQRFKRV